MITVQSEKIAEFNITHCRLAAAALGEGSSAHQESSSDKFDASPRDVLIAISNK